MPRNSNGDAKADAFWKAAEAYAHHLADNEGDVELAWVIRGFADASVGHKGKDKNLSQDRNYGRYYKRGWESAQGLP